MSVVEYSLKFFMFYRYDPSLFSNTREEMIRFVIGVVDLVREECRMTMLHDDMTVARLTVHNQLKSLN